MLPNIFSIFLLNGIYNFNLKSNLQGIVAPRVNLEKFPTNKDNKISSIELKMDDIEEYENEFRWVDFFCVIHPRYTCTTCNTAILPKTEEELCLIADEILNSNDIELDIPTNNDVSDDQVRDVALFTTEEEKK